MERTEELVKALRVWYDDHDVRQSVIVTKDNLAVAPSRGLTATFRSEPYRVTLVSDLVTSWEIRLVQQFA